MFLQEDKENVYGISSLPYQPAYEETLPTAQRRQEKSAGASQQPTHERRTPPMPKARATRLVNKMKRWVVVSSLVSTGAFGGLIMTHLSVSGTTSQNQSTQTASSSTTSKTTATATSQTTTTATATPTASTTSSASSSGGFLQQQGGDQFGSTSSSQQPVTSSHSS